MKFKWTLAGRKLLIGLSVILSGNLVIAQATNYFVASNGSDNNDGLALESPYKTITKANSKVSPGDTVFIREGVYLEQTIAPSNSGTEDNRIVYTNYNGEKARIENSDLGVKLTEKSYITVHGIEVFFCKKYMMMDNAHHNYIEYCVFDSAKNNTSFTGVAVGGPNASYNWIHHCSISRYGGTTNENGDMLSLEGRVPNPGYVHHNLIENNHVFQGRHNVIATSGQFNIIRNNYFHSEEWDEGGQYGGRIAEIKGTRETSNWNLLEGNRFGFSGIGDARTSSPGIKLVSPDNIVRFNLVYSCKGPGIQVVEHATDGPFGSDNNYLFHNVFYHNGLDKDGAYGLWFRNGAVNTAVVKNNIFYDNPTHIGLPGTNTIESNWLEGSPEFVDAESELLDPANANYPDFNLRESSGCIDAGIFLTNTVVAGSGTEIAVEDAHYFIDGWGIVDGDIIQLEGQNETVQITNIDYENNIITVDKTIEWIAGLGISFPYQSSAPDMGAFESDYIGEKKKYYLSINTTGKGIVTISHDSVSYSEGTIVTLTAIPDSGEQFIEWSGDLSGVDNPGQITFDANKNVTATFTSVTSPVTEEFVVEEIESQTGQFEARWSAHSTSDLVDGIIGFSQGIPIEYNQLCCKILFSNSGEIKVSNGSSFTSEQIVGYSANHKFTFRMNVDISSQTYSVWVTPDGEDEILLANMYQFHPSQEIIESINYRSVKMSFDEQWGGAEGMVDISDFDIITGVERKLMDQEIPSQYLLNCYPNPFNPSTTISYNLPRSGGVEIVIFDTAGRRVIELINVNKSAGRHSVKWNAKDMYGRKVASGIYVYQLKHKEHKIAKKMMLLR